jgi:thioredoxin-related protein
MRRFALGFFVFVAIFGHDVQAGDKPELKWKSFDAGFAEAKKTNKKIMLDIYTDWCGWCKRLDKDTYGNEKVMEYLNQQYIVIKLNAESTSKVNYQDKTYTEASLAQAFGATGYPTIVFFDSNGEPINSLGGYLNAEKFLPVITYIGDDHYKSMTWEEYQNKEKKPAKD